MHAFPCNQIHIYKFERFDIHQESLVLCYLQQAGVARIKKRVCIPGHIAHKRHLLQIVPHSLTQLEGHWKLYCILLHCCYCR